MLYLFKNKYLKRIQQIYRPIQNNSGTYRLGLNISVFVIRHVGISTSYTVDK